MLPEAVLQLAQVQPGELWVDCTLGAGGHSRLLLEAGAQVIGLDQDPEIRAHTQEALKGQAIRILAGNFRDLEALLEAQGLGKVNGLLADLGVSSYQLDTPSRGFSFSSDGPVDMRMDPSLPQSAEGLIESLDERALARLLRSYGEEPLARPIARALKAWLQGPRSTRSLAQAVSAAIPRRLLHKRKHHPATRSFQALRIAVNDELGALDALLEALPALLKPGGRALIISFHSLEDRRVKRAFRSYSRPAAPPRRGLPPPPSAQPPLFEELNSKVIRADAAEQSRNRRSRSALLRGLRRHP